jgi:pimeloyl-ACP methyl ester carboxylesterase
MSTSVVVERYGAQIHKHQVVGGGGATLNVLEAGRRDGPTVLFIHGFSQNALAWSKQLDSELARDHRLVAMDLRGHGNSDKPPKEAYTDSKLWADDVQAVIEALGLDRPVLSGWSYGGLIMCDYVAAYGETAIGGLHFVNAITRVGEPVLPFLGPDFLAQVPGFFSNDVQESSAALRRFMRLCVYEEPSAQDFYLFLGYNTIVPPYVREGLFSRSLEHDSLLRRLTVPVLITHGDEDAIVLRSMGEHTARMISGARASYYPNVGHATFWEAPDRFNRELHDFVRSTIAV